MILITTFKLLVDVHEWVDVHDEELEMVHSHDDVGVVDKRVPLVDVHEWMDVHDEELEMVLSHDDVDVVDEGVPLVDVHEWVALHDEEHEMLLVDVHEWVDVHDEELEMVHSHDDVGVVDERVPLVDVHEWMDVHDEELEMVLSHDDVDVVDEGVPLVDVHEWVALHDEEHEMVQSHDDVDVEVDVGVPLAKAHDNRLGQTAKRWRISQDIELDYHSMLEKAKPLIYQIRVLVAKFFTKQRINLEATTRTLKSMWRSGGSFDVRDLKNNMAMISFEDEDDPKRIIMQGPWSFNKFQVAHAVQNNSGQNMNSMAPHTEGSKTQLIEATVTRDVNSDEINDDGGTILRHDHGEVELQYNPTEREILATPIMFKEHLKDIDNNLSKFSPKDNSGTYQLSG
nr:hypothetical protein CFP56_18884 [Quercus suber]